MTQRYSIRSLAQADLESIWLYTCEEWGVTQSVGWGEARTPTNTQSLENVGLRTSAQPTILDEWKEDGRTPEDFLRTLERQATKQPYCDNNFLKKPFLKACRDRGLFDLL